MFVTLQTLLYLHVSNVKFSRILGIVFYTSLLLIKHPHLKSDVIGDRVSK